MLRHIIKRKKPSKDPDFSWCLFLICIGELCVWAFGVRETTLARQFFSREVGSHRTSTQDQLLQKIFNQELQIYCRFASVEQYRHIRLIAEKNEERIDFERVNANKLDNPALVDQFFGEFDYQSVNSEDGLL